MSPKRTTDDETEGIEEDEAYQHLNPEGLKDLDFSTDRNWHRKLEMLDKDILEENTRKLEKISELRKELSTCKAEAEFMLS